MSEGRALVTGASSGIGKAFARALHARGDKLVLVARRRERLAELAKELGGEDVAVVLPVDLSAPDGPERVAAEVQSRGFTVDMLVNNAGMGHTAPFCREDRGRALAMVDLNVRAVVALTHAFLPGMVERKRGAVINVASNAAFQPLPFFAVYAATKAFVLSFTEALATELKGSGVRVQALCPGITATEFLDVAGTHDGLLVKKMPGLTPQEVVAVSLLALESGKLRVVVGWANRLVAAAVRLSPRGLVRTVAAQLYKP